MVMSALFIITKEWTQPKSLLTDELLNKLCYINTMEFYQALTKAKELLITQ